MADALLTRLRTGDDAVRRRVTEVNTGRHESRCPVVVTGNGIEAEGRSVQPVVQAADFAPYADTDGSRPQQQPFCPCGINHPAVPTPEHGESGAALHHTSVLPRHAPRKVDLRLVPTNRPILLVNATRAEASAQDGQQQRSSKFRHEIFPVSNVRRFEAVCLPSVTLPIRPGIPVAKAEYCAGSLPPGKL